MQVHGRFEFPGLISDSADLALERLNLVNNVEFDAVWQVSVLTAPRLDMPGHFYLAPGYLPDQHEPLGGPGGQRAGLCGRSYYFAG